jgi:3-deoxy-D-manno-octulosonate 8-phosphate phosphatase (KDO 8-P phosphatase)
MTGNNHISEGLSLDECIYKIRLAVFDFDGVFTDNMVYVFQDGTEAVRCFRGDGFGLRKLEQAGIATLIISTETNPLVSIRSRKLGVRCIHGCENKLAALETIAQEMSLSMEQIAYVGNDINDLTCLGSVGLPIIVHDAHPDVIPFARYRTAARGGHGAVREVCDLFERVLVSKHD